MGREVFEAAQAQRVPCGRRNPSIHRRPKHLLSGLLSCGACGGSLVVRTRKEGIVYFGCSVHMNRPGCENGRYVPTPEVEARVLAALKAHLLAPDVIKTAVEVYRAERIRLSREASRVRASLERELAEVNRKIKWLMKSKAAGGQKR